MKLWLLEAVVFKGLCGDKSSLGMEIKKVVNSCLVRQELGALWG